LGDWRLTLKAEGQELDTASGNNGKWRCGLSDNLLEGA